VVVPLGRRVDERLPAADKAVVDVSTLKIPDKAGSEFIKAVKFQQKNDLAKAEEHLKAAIKIYPNYAEAYNNLGVIYINQNRVDDAEQAFAKATEIMPNNAIALKNLGQARMRAGHYREAIAPLSSATQLDSTDAKALASLGESYLRVKNLSNARDCFEKSVVLNPRLAFSRFRLGSVCLEQRDYEAALKHFRAFLGLEPVERRAEIEALVAKLQSEVQNTRPKAAAMAPGGDAPAE
jgi:superkiller protein 3